MMRAALIGNVVALPAEAAGPLDVTGIASAWRYAAAARAASTRDKYNRAWNALDGAHRRAQIHQGLGRSIFVPRSLQ